MEYSINYREKDKGIQVIIQYKDTNGRWKQKSKQGFKKKKLAKLYADKLLEELKESVKYNQDYIEYTIGQLKELYLEDSKLYKEHNTYVNKLKALKRFELDDVKFVDIKKVEIQQCINKMTAINFAPRTIEAYLGIFKSFLTWCSDNFDLPYYNFRKFSVPKSKAVNTKKALSQEELNKLIYEFKENMDRNLNFYISVLLAGKAGLRAGEICGLTWNDIDFEAGVINVNKQYKRLKEKDGKYGFGELKSKLSYRSIPMNAFLRKELLFIKSNFPINIDSRLLSLSGTVVLTVNINKVLRKNYGITIHELRHTFATNLIASGLDFKTTASILGHKVEETMNTYSHVTCDMFEKAKSIINLM